MASHPPARCCTIGVKHEGETTGKSIKIGSIEAYVAEPTGNTIHKDTLMADQFAANGYHTVLVDLFNGDPMVLENRPEGFEPFKWMKGGTNGKNPHTIKEVDPTVQKAVEYLKEQGFKKIGAVGYCFGAKYVVRFMEKGKGIDVGYVAHPSLVEESELSAINGPLSIAAAENDFIFPAEKRHKSEELLVETKQPYQINLYSGVSHGFSVRCDLSKKVEKYAKEQAFLQAVAWFDEHLI